MFGTFITYRVRCLKGWERTENTQSCKMMKRGCPLRSAPALANFKSANTRNLLNYVRAGVITAIFKYQNIIPIHVEIDNWHNIAQLSLLFNINCFQFPSILPHVTFPNNLLITKTIVVIDMGISLKFNHLKHLGSLLPVACPWDHQWLNFTLTIGTFTFGLQYQTIWKPHRG